MLSRLIILLGILVGVLVQVSAFKLTPILTIPDSFSYIQMATYLKEWKLDGLWTGWFWPLYSGFVALFNSLISDSFSAGKWANVLLMGWGGFLLFQIGRRYLDGFYCFVLLVLYGLSSSLLYYKINVLSENLYIPLFLLLILLLHKFLEWGRSFNALLVGATIGCMYLTRGEAFIYLWSIVVLFLILSSMRFFTFWEGIRSMLLLFFWFFLIASPYIYYLHTVTGEWWLTNKWASNIRQAMMRWVEHMDDDGFEKAVGELDESKTKLLSGFVWWLKYEKPTGDYSLKQYITGNFPEFLNTFEENQKKLYAQTIPSLILWDVTKMRKDIHFPFAQTFPFVFILYFPFAFIIFWIWKMLSRREVNLIIITLPLFLTASFFFTMFFVLERYFIIFLPLAFIVMLYGCQNFFWNELSKHRYKFIILSILMVGIQWLWFWYTYSQPIDQDYSIKKMAGEWLQKNKSTLFNGKEPIRIMERWPVVTYYSKENERWLTPYTESLNDIETYAKANQIDILVVDSLDFLTYRPQLKNLLISEWTHPWLEKINGFSVNGQKVILYKFTY